MTIAVTTAGWNIDNLDLDTDIVLGNPSGLTGDFTKFCNEILTWGWENYIEVDIVAKWSDNGVTYSAWRIPNESHRTMFALRWMK